VANALNFRECASDDDAMPGAVVLLRLMIQIPGCC
jgi:hypothetical protein